MGSMVQALMGFLIYNLIVRRRGTASSFLVGYGLIIPIVMTLPFYILEFFDIQNIALRTVLVQVPICVGFRTIEAMYGTTPEAAMELSMGNYVIYHSSNVHHIWDNKA